MSKVKGSTDSWLAGLLVAVAVPAAAIVYDVPTDEVLIDALPVIVYGEIEYTAHLPNGRFTDAALRVDRVLKGLVAGDRIHVRQRGGFANGRGLKVMGLPMLRRGDRVMLALVPEKGGTWRTVGLGLGLFFEDRGLLLRAGVPEHHGRDLERFSRWVVDRAAGSERPADYFVDRVWVRSGSLRPTSWQPNGLLATAAPKGLSGT